MERLFLCIIFFYVCQCLAQDDFKIDPATSKAIPNYLAKVKLKKGEAFRIDEEGNKKPIENGFKLQIGDQVETGVRSYVSMEVIDDSVISLGPNSKFQFSKFEFKDKKDRKSLYRFIEGQMRAHISHKAKPGDLQFKTKTTSLGIRGTVFLANTYSNPDGAEFFECAVLEGKIEATSKGVAEPKTVAAGEHYLYLKDGEEVDQGTKPLPEDVFQDLLRLEADAGKEELPFLAMYNEPFFSREKGRLPASKTGSEALPSKKNGKEDNANKPGWRDTLQNLNKVLEDYNAPDDGRP